MSFNSPAHIVFGPSSPCRFLLPQRFDLDLSASVLVQPTTPHSPPSQFGNSHGGLPRGLLHRRLRRRRGRRGGRGLRHADAAPPHAAAARARRLRLRAPVARRHAGPGRRRLARRHAAVPGHGEQPARILLLVFPRGRWLLLRRLLLLLPRSRLRRDPRPERRVLQRNLALPRVELRLRIFYNPKGERDLICPSSRSHFSTASCAAELFADTVIRVSRTLAWRASMLCDPCPENWLFSNIGFARSHCSCGYLFLCSIL